MGLLQRWAGEVGAAVGAYQRSLQRAKVNRPAFLGSWAESERYKGDNLTPRMAQRRAMLNSWVYTAVQFIAREASAAPFQVVDTSGDEPVIAPKHPLVALIQRPNPVMGRAFLWQYTIAWLQVSGNAYWFVGCDGANRPLELWPLPAHDVEPVPGDEERFIDYYEYTANGAIYRIPAEYLVHFRLPNPFDVFRGLSPLSAALLASDSDTAMARWNAQFFGNDNVMPSAIINLSSGDPAMPVNPADAEALKSDLRAGYAAHRRKTAVTAVNRLDVSLLGWSAREMDFISGRQFTKEEIYSIYGIPGGLLDKNATEANAVTADQVFKEKTVWPLLNLIAEQLTTELVWLFYGSQTEAQFEDIRPRNRALEMQEVDRAKGALTVNEVRQQYWQLGPLPDGDALYGAQAAPALSRMMDAPAAYDAAPEPPAAAPAALSEARAADLRRWRSKALKAAQAGKPQPVFVSRFIPAAEAGQLGRLLRTARTVEQVRTVFDIALKAAPEVETVDDDPHRLRKQQAEQALERDLLAYFGGLERRIIEAVQADG